ncbi:MAG TPA: MFS transporter [Beijerinckiaceae bacterium]|nr:MFS transporter [Beijerinckiaceae bacterium]
MIALDPALEERAVEQNAPAALIARLERIPVWSLPTLFIGVIGLGFLFTFYDIFDINVSFIQTCMAVIHGCTPPTAGEHIGLPVLLNLVGYVVGALILCPLSDRFGRRDMLLATMLLTGVGSILTAAVGSYGWFVFARALTGVGIGADLAIVNTYINEMAPRRGRARYASVIFIFSALGALVGIWLGLLLTTPPTPLPLGLPFALAGPQFAYGWRVMYAAGGLLALVGVLLRFQLPESPRWLIARGRNGEAADVIAAMEARARLSRELEPPAVAMVRAPASAAAGSPYREILGDPLYRGRIFVLLAMWFASYVTIYAFSAGFTTVLASLAYPPPEAGLITAIGAIGFLFSALAAAAWGDRLERKSWLPIAAALTLLGALIVALAGNALWMSVLGSLVIFFGFNLWVPIAYAWSSECFPTRARTTGFGLVDGLGHLGGGVGLVVIAPMIPTLGPLRGLLLISGFLVVAAAVAQFGVRGRARALDELSP